MRLGKLPKRHDPRTLKLARYLPAALPPPPPAVDHASKLPGDLGMMGNDRLGDCTCAAAGHLMQSWSSYAGQPVNPSEGEIIDAYRVLSPEDQGCVMLEVLRYWRKHGIAGNRAAAFVELATGDLQQARLAIELFGGVYIGMALPDEHLEGPWTTPTGPMNYGNGHAVCLLGYDDSHQSFLAATWGQVVLLSYAWYQRYCDEAWAILDSLDRIQATGKSPEGFAWGELRQDVGLIARAA